MTTTSLTPASPPPTGAPYRTNHATFTLPPQLRDKTMHMFTLTDSGPSEFSVVISHADAGHDETLHGFSTRLVQELQKSLPRFELARSQARTLDGAEAIELFYSWRSEGTFLHQRQVVTLMPGEQPNTRKAMMVGATCLRAFTDEWNAAFDDVLGSMRLRHQAAPALAPEAASTVFALSERRRTLHAFASREEAASKIDAREVEQDAWAFFDAAGAPLHADFVVPNSGTLWRKPGTYVLVARPDVAAAPLRERLHQAAIFLGSSGVPYASLAEVQAQFGPGPGASEER